MPLVLIIWKLRCFMKLLLANLIAQTPSVRARICSWFRGYSNTRDVGVISLAEGECISGVALAQLRLETI
jgi:hypothetical protein